MTTSKTPWAVVALLVISAIINYVDRGSLSIAAPIISDDLAIDPVRIGFLLSAFFYTYAFCQIVSGWLADRFRVTAVFAAGFLLWSLATFCSGFAAGLASLTVCRLLLGAGESVAFPAYSKIIATGFPAEKRGLPNAMIEAGTKLGPAIGTLIGGFLVASYGWRALFISLGSGSLLWLVPWLIWGPRGLKPAPATAARVTQIPMAAILSRRDAWGTFIGNACYTYSYYFLLTWLPTYLVKERHVSLQAMGVLGSLPFWAAAAAAVLCGWISDRWISSGASPTRVRKTFVATGLLCSTIIVPSALVSSLALSMTLLSLGYVAFAIFASNHWAITQTLAGPTAAGKWTGLQNTLGSLSGVVAPVVTGWIVSETGGFYWAFVSPAILAVVGACCYLFVVGPVRPIDWGET